MWGRRPWVKRGALVPVALALVARERRCEELLRMRRAAPARRLARLAAALDPRPPAPHREELAVG
eukprot:2563541-Pleurochrysis_carterae.AAC.1